MGKTHHVRKMFFEILDFAKTNTTIQKPSLSHGKICNQFVHRTNNTKVIAYEGFDAVGTIGGFSAPMSR